MVYTAEVNCARFTNGAVIDPIICDMNEVSRWYDVYKTGDHRACIRLGPFGKPTILPNLPKDSTQKIFDMDLEDSFENQYYFTSSTNILWFFISSSKFKSPFILFSTTIIDRHLYLWAKIYSI